MMRTTSSYNISGERISTKRNNTLPSFENDMIETIDGDDAVELFFEADPRSRRRKDMHDLDKKEFEGEGDDSDSWL